MIISDWSVENRITVFFLIFMIFVGGLFCYFSLPRESAPDIPIPYVFITTTYRGGSPEDIEKLITIPIEDKLKGLSGVKKIKSVSEDSQSLISVEFHTGIDIDEVLPKVKDKVDLAKPDLPTDLEDDPVITETNFSEMPIFIIGMSGDFGAKQLGKLADDFKDEIEGIEGVLEADIAGKVDRQIQVQIFPERLTQYNISVESLIRIIGRENQNVSGGSIKLPQGRFQLRVPGEFKTPEEAESLVIAVNNDGPVYLRDIGFVTDGLEDVETTSRVNGDTAITLSVKKQAGANAIEIVDKVNNIIKENRKSWPKGLKITRLMDRSKEIKNMVSDLEDNMLSGLLLVIVVVCIAMGFRNSIIVSLSIPLSMLLTFVVLKVIGITLNMVVLFSLTLALGMLVDNAIVIVENIYRFMQQGVGRVEAAKRATSEVALPIIGSALTTIAAFFPLLWWDGIMGSFMSYIPKTVIITLICCLFVALIINPAVAAAVMKAKGSGRKRMSADDIQQQGEHPMLEGGGLILEMYRKILTLALRNRLAVLVCSLGFMILMFQMWMWRIGLEKPQEFFPTPDPKDIYVNFNMPQGCGIKYSDNMVKATAKRIYAQPPQNVIDFIQKKIDAIRDNKRVEGQLDTSYLQNISYAESMKPKKHIYQSSGKEYLSPSWLPNVEYIFEKASFRPGMQFFGEGSDNQIGIHFVDLEDRSENSLETKSRIEQLIKDIPGAEITVESEQAGPPTGKPINIEIHGEDFTTLGKLANQVKEYVKKVPFTRNIRSNFESGSPTIEIEVNRKIAGFLGLQTDLIGYIIRSAFNGAKVSNYREGDEKYDIIVRFDDANRGMIDTLRQIFVTTPHYGKIPLTTIADIKYTGGLGRITRIDNKRVVTVSADIDTGKTTGAVALQQAMALMSGSSLITSEQVKDWPGLINMLKEKKTPQLQRLYEKLDSNAQSIISTYNPSSAVTGQQKAALIIGLNEALNSPTLYSTDSFDLSKLPLNIQSILSSVNNLENLEQKDLQEINRSLIESAIPQTLKASESKAFTTPSGYGYSFTGENEEMEKATKFIGGALAVALLLIVFVLVAQFNSVIYPMVIMSAVILSLGGVFLGLGVAALPFGIVMTGVGVISLAGVVVNNAIVLVDYTIQLRNRGMSLHEAIIAAGATRLRPVLLTAITTILGLIPMAVGWSFDFHDFHLQTASESSQWWQSMAVPVIFGLMCATVLTLVVVPVLLSLTSKITYYIKEGWREVVRLHIGCAYKWIRLYDRIHKTNCAEEWKQKKLRDIAHHHKSGD